MKWLAVVLPAGILALAGWFPQLGAARERAYAASCQSSLQMIRRALLMYTSDYDERLPLDASLQDLVAKGWRGPGHPQVTGDWGPIGVYTKNACMFFCPADPYNRRADQFPTPGISYRWNRALAGKLVNTIAPDMPLVWDRAPFHPEQTRNAALIGKRTGRQGRVVAMEEEHFKAVLKKRRSRE